MIVSLIPMQLEHKETRYLYSQINKVILKFIMPKPS